MNLLAYKGYQSQQFTGSLATEASRPDGVLPPGWAHIQQPWPNQGLLDVNARRRSWTWAEPSAPNLAWERMNLACVGVVAILVAFAIIAAVG